ncbi:hypothetical protein DLAC_09375 [Tieghemostelium lacteum]|uniref:Uncharacterized protein n=1 Tax=Tieghemostelium lacteum TaxID=361077 RepID=A0A151Z9V9_TIELA|nr:hypothetical protein DLAC_09375 [Tieghemostelium lacteum]|eukprot:KYQ90738.1 hypothetical protein DLAC_09375 [Tieghemostelium lacteum]
MEKKSKLITHNINFNIPHYLFIRIVKIILDNTQVPEKYKISLSLINKSTFNSISELYCNTLRCKALTEEFINDLNSHLTSSGYCLLKKIKTIEIQVNDKVMINTFIRDSLKKISTSLETLKLEYQDNINAPILLPITRDHFPNLIYLRMPIIEEHLKPEYPESVHYPPLQSLYIQVVKGDYIHYLIKMLDGVKDTLLHLTIVTGYFPSFTSVETEILQNYLNIYKPNQLETIQLTETLNLHPIYKNQIRCIKSLKDGKHFKGMEFLDLVESCSQLESLNMTVYTVAEFNRISIMINTKPTLKKLLLEVSIPRNPDDVYEIWDEFKYLEYLEIYCSEDKLGYILYPNHTTKSLKTLKITFSLFTHNALVDFLLHNQSLTTLYFSSNIFIKTSEDSKRISRKLAHHPTLVNLYINLNKNLPKQPSDTMLFDQLHKSHSIQFIELSSTSFDIEKVPKPNKPFFEIPSKTISKYKSYAYLKNGLNYN